MKRLFAMALAALLLFCAGCEFPFPKEEEGSPHAGVYQAVTAGWGEEEKDITEVHRNGVTVQLEKDGLCRIVCDDMFAEGEWTADGEDIFINGEGIAYCAKVYGERMVLRDSMSLGLYLTFVKEEEEVRPGYYPLKLVKEGDTSRSAAHYESIGMGGSYLELREDGTGTLYFSGQSPDVFEWTQEGILTDDAGVVPMVVSGGDILLEIGDVTAVFSRTES